MASGQWHQHSLGESSSSLIHFWSEAPAAPAAVQFPYLVVVTQLFNHFAYHLMRCTAARSAPMANRRAVAAAASALPTTAEVHSSKGKLKRDLTCLTF